MGRQDEGEVAIDMVCGERTEAFPKGVIELRIAAEGNADFIEQDNGWVNELVTYEIKKGFDRTRGWLWYLHLVKKIG